MTPTRDDIWAFDHLGLVVKRLEKGRQILSAALRIEDWTAEVVDPVNGVRLQFGRDPAGVVYELLEPLNEQSPVYNALVTGKAILNHVAYRTADLAAAAVTLRAAGCAPVAAATPAIAYGGRLIQFFVSPLRLVIELIEAPAHEHIYYPISR
jgi:methylmalonyl-CoA/ethylmalonyl-CoA epimerase